MEHHVAAGALFASLKSRGLEASTARRYLRVLEQLSPTWSDLKDFKSPKPFKEKLAALAPTTRQMALSVVTTVLRDAKKPRAAWGKLAKKALSEAPPLNEKSSKQAANWVTQAEAAAVYQRAIDSASWTDAMLLFLYTRMPPRRESDYLNMRVASDEVLDTTCNWYDLASATFVFNQYKTVKRYGQQVVRVPAEFEELFNADARHRHWLFASPQSTGWIGKRLSKLFGRRVGVGMLRASYVTEHAAPGGAKELAAAMGHSVGIQQAVYLKR